MQFELDDHQVMLRDSVHRYIQDEYSFEQRRKRLHGAAGFDAPTWAQFAEFGWLAAPFDEQWGGLGGSAVEAGIVMEGFGQALVVEPYLPCVVLAGGAIADIGNDEQRQACLPAIAGGERLFALAWVEPQARYDLADCATTATPIEGSDSGWVLRGRKALVLGGAGADRFVVAARSSGDRQDRNGIDLFLVDRDQVGVEVIPYPTFDGQRACDLVLHDVRVGADARLGAAGQGLDALERSIDRGISAIAFEAVGAMSALLDQTLEYLRGRSQFGRPLSTNQALQHRLVDMHIALEESRAMAGYGAFALSMPDASQRRKALSAVKIQIGKAARLIGQEAIQMHGAIGTTEECAASHYFKRLTAIELTFGNTSFHERRFAEH